MEERNRLRKWVIANAIGLAIGMTIAYTAFVVLAFDPTYALQYAAWATAGLSVAAAQIAALPLARSHPTRWSLAGIAAAAIGLPFGIAAGVVGVFNFPHWLVGSNTPISQAFISALFGLVPGGTAGLCAGSVLGAIQAPAIPASLNLRTSWVLSSAKAWLAAGALFGALVSLSGVYLPVDRPTIVDWVIWLSSLFLIGALSGAVAGLIMRAPSAKVLRVQPLANASQQPDAA